MTLLERVDQIENWAGFVSYGKVKFLCNALRVCVEAVEAARVLVPDGIKTRDVGTCSDCGGGTSSGMDRWCKPCARKRLSAALRLIEGEEATDGGE